MDKRYGGPGCTACEKHFDQQWNPSKKFLDFFEQLKTNTQTKESDVDTEYATCKKCEEWETNCRAKPCSTCRSNSNFKPKENKMKASDYEILRDCTLDTLIEDGNSFEALKFYRDNFRGYEHWNGGAKLAYVIKNYPKTIHCILQHLIENKYIKLIERAPEPGEVWKDEFEHYKIISETYGNYTFDRNSYYKKENATAFNKQWKKIYTKEEFINHLKQIG